MSPQPIAFGEGAGDTPAAAPAAPVHTRPFFWSVRRELWEHPSIYLAPIAVGALSAIALVAGAFILPESERAMVATGSGAPGSLAGLYWYAAVPMLFTAFATGALYCLDALNGERRDRGILFWKSLPVSDGTVVLSKAAVAMVVLPLLTLAMALLVNVVMLLVTAAVAASQGGPASTGSEVGPFGMWATLVYTVVVATLWHAPIFSFLLLVSGSARRVSALWLVLPVPAIILAETLTYNAFKATWVKYRLMGWYDESFGLKALSHTPFHPSASLTPGNLLRAPGLWSGLLFAALCLFAAARLRRKRGAL